LLDRKGGINNMALQLSPQVKIITQEGPARTRDIQLARGRFHSLPSEYIEIVSESNKLEVEIGNGRRFILWGPLSCMDNDDTYRISKRIPGAVPVGTDGADHLYFYGNGDHGWGLYSTTSDPEAEPITSVWIAGGLRQLLEENEGADRLP
jgi:hypothetical protein